jgi:uncharacterized phage protein (TIGR01671 family)
MRTIKFRAYAAGKMYYPQSFCFDMGGKRISFQPDDGGGGTFVSEEFTQFTGLHDKNGVEIYEGDIILFSENSVHEGTKAKVIWHDKRGGFVCQFISGVHCGQCTNVFDEWRTDEVIGNIYESADMPF